MSRIRFCPVHGEALTPNGWCFTCDGPAPIMREIIKQRSPDRAPDPVPNVKEQLKQIYE